MKSLCAFPLLLAATAAAATPSVEVANGDWSKLPQLSQRGYEHLNEKMMAKLYEIADSKQCPSFALNQGKLDFRIGFAVQYDATGNLARVVLPRLECSDAESVAGGALLEMLEAGDYAPNGKSRNGWYQGTLGFSFAGKSAVDTPIAKVAAQPGAVKGANPTEVVCEKVEVMGTRLASNRVCMTRAEWAQRKHADREEVERVQTQRGCGATMTC